jgi:hypothetical protein
VGQDSGAALKPFLRRAVRRIVAWRLVKLCRAQYGREETQRDINVVDGGEDA